MPLLRIRDCVHEQREGFRQIKTQFGEANDKSSPRTFHGKPSIKMKYYARSRSIFSKRKFLIGSKALAANAAADAFGGQPSWRQGTEHENR
jgi:hypothetical protein